MWEFAGFIGTFLCGIGMMALRDAFFKGKNAVRLNSIEAEQRKIQERMTEGFEKLSKEISDFSETKDIVQRHGERMLSLTRDNQRLLDSVDELNNTNSTLNQSVVKMDATLQGLSNLIDHIIKGDLRMANQS